MLDALVTCRASRLADRIAVRYQLILAIAILHTIAIFAIERDGEIPQRVNAVSGEHKNEYRGP